MTSDYDSIANDFLQVTLAIGKEKSNVGEAIGTLEATVTSICHLNDLREIWQVTQESNNVLRILYPEYSAVLGNEDPRMPSAQETIPVELSTNIMIRQILCGVQVLDGNTDCKKGASKLLDEYPRAVAESASPYVDDKGIWDHTHGEVDES